ncbi:alpha/beta family hydrolase [Dactylosporangium sp. AC04546]|nr:alpha/beta family hydrolase [Dactylosporangium sp. AC04546]WVK89483.1 alpha/beta family hydrolase [Dactylosporangium sp. AC04546]
MRPAAGSPAARPVKVTKAALARARGLSVSREAVETAFGTALYDLDVPRGFDGTLLVLGHGAGGDVDAKDLVAVRDGVLGGGGAVAMVTQPYRVAGRRAPAPAGQLDTAWLAVLAALRERLPVRTLVVGGRSSGARVACRTAREGGADRILALAFPLHPPGKPEKSRAEELGTGLPTLVINGDRDPFGVPDGSPTVIVEVLPGETHGLSKHPEAVAVLAAPFVLT